MSARGPHIQEQTPSQTADRVLAFESHVHLNSGPEHPCTLFYVPGLEERKNLQIQIGC